MRFPIRVFFLAAVTVLLLGGATIAHALTRGDTTVEKTARPPAHAETLRTFTFVGGGDMAFTGDAEASVLAGIRRYVRHNDVAVANLEGTLTTGGSAKCGSASTDCFAFRASPAWAATLRWTGFNVLNVANNHALDFGPEGQRETLAALRREDLGVQGLPGRITYVSAAGVKVALIGCAPYRWAQSLLDVEATARLVGRASRHANVVIVYMHAGAEGSDAAHVRNDEAFLGEPRGNPRAFAHAMVAAGADLVFGSGPHIIRGIEWYHGRLIAYSLGNLAGTHTLSTDGALANSALLRVTLQEDGTFAAASIVPLKLVGGGTPVFDSSGAAIERIRMLSHEDFGARATRIASSGRLAPPRS